ncbi:MAG: hypothetical protein K1565_13645 [Candidatus Thiodiazotropha sp. (ex. Lucinisca nassula)]|nr:hypothetical protein [Candidatus Thiodiazotropha sp. (ex. Lucinisca nassula)]
MKVSNRAVSGVSVPRSVKRSDWMTVLDMGIPTTGESQPVNDRAHTRRGDGYNCMP